MPPPPLTRWQSTWRYAVALATSLVAWGGVAPGQWRGNGPIMQQGAFGAAYGCKAGTPMQPKPEQRIAIFR